jgi:hypothetical protein
MTTETITRLAPTEEAEIRERVQEASPGRWGTSRDLAGVYAIHSNLRSDAYGFYSDGVIAVITEEPNDGGRAYRNSKFLSRARDDMAAVLAELDAVRGERDAARAKQPAKAG